MKTRINALVKLGDYIMSHQDELDKIIQYAFQKNSWFTPDFIQMAIDTITTKYLSREELTNWTNAYHVKNGIQPSVIGIIMAGNIPLVGFHDWLSCFISGHNTMIKLSSKDEVLLKALINILYSLEDQELPTTEFVDRLTGFDVVIATGSNNSALHFEHYFKKYPHIIRRNRTSVAILDGLESKDQLIGLSHDVFDYFGMGCRNVSKIFIPEDYDFNLLNEILENEYPIMLQHNKYRNNFDYNFAIFIMNGTIHTALSSIILLENSDIYSRMASLHYEFYTDISDVVEALILDEMNIQCVVSEIVHLAPSSERFGYAQRPKLNNYADGVDTMEFVCALS